MKRIPHVKASPATVIALVALVVAVAGVAYATIPDSTGTIHACYQKRSGDLRVVRSADDCRSSERALSWNQQGPAGAAVVARMRGGPFTFTDFSTREIPLSGATWTQQAGEYQEVVGQVDIDFGCGSEYGPPGAVRAGRDHRTHAVDQRERALPSWGDHDQLDQGERAGVPLRLASSRATSGATASITSRTRAMLSAPPH